MDRARVRSCLITSLTQRVANALDRCVTEDVAVRVALCCGMRDPELALHVITNHMIAKKALTHVDSLRITTEQFNILFGTNLCGQDEKAVEVINNNEDIGITIKMIEESLTNCFSLSQSLGALNWKQPACRLASVVAMEMEDAVESLRGVIGPFGEGDARRIGYTLDEIQCRRGDDGNLHAVQIAMNELIRISGWGK